MNSLFWAMTLLWLGALLVMAAVQWCIHKIDWVLWKYHIL